MRINNRDKILNTARKLFPKKGYNAVSVRDIASRAGLTTGAIYFHFENKWHIYRTICFEAIEILIKIFKDGTERQTSSHLKLLSTFNSYFYFYDNYRDHYNVLSEYKAAYSSGDKNVTDEIALKMKDLILIMSQNASLGIESGYFKKLDPDMLSMFLATFTEGILHFRKMGLFESMNIDDKKFKKFILDVLWNGIKN
jgi:AcrR family transcriptional regulator